MAKRLFICGHRTFFQKALVAAAALLALALVICGIAISWIFYVAAALLLTLLFLYLCIQRWAWKNKKPKKMQVFTLYDLDYYSQVPSGLKSDYPMGPYLIMTLPAPDTPVHFKRKSKKNQPPLASMETLTPSIISSTHSIDSVV